jgi:hypothetical protein
LFQQFAAAAREYYSVVLAEQGKRSRFSDSAPRSGNDGYFGCHLGMLLSSGHYEAKGKIRYNSKGDVRPDWLGRLLDARRAATILARAGSAPAYATNGIRFG